MSTSKLKVAKEKKMKAYFGVHNLKKNFTTKLNYDWMRFKIKRMFRDKQLYN